jgi:hypothetical protein
VTLAAAARSFDAYESGRVGASVRQMALRGLAPAEAHARLLAAGFTVTRLALPAWTTRTGEPQWRLWPSGATPAGREVPALASAYVYVHPDGGVVRLFPHGSGLASLEVVPGAWARKSVLLGGSPPRDPSLDLEAFAVTDPGNPLPKSPRAAHGLKYDAEDRPRSHALARAVLVTTRVPLGAGASPALPLAGIAAGLSRGLTLVPEGDFWQLARSLRMNASNEPVLFRKEDGDVRIFFTGDEALARALRAEAPRTGLASLCIHRGSAVFSMEPVGYEGSVEHLARFVAGWLARAGAKCRWYESATGRDLGLVAERRPSLLFGADAPGDVAIDPG